MKYKIIGTFTGKCCDSTVYNNNGMLLNRELFEILINSEEYQRAMQNRYYIGFLGHPEDPNDMNFMNACIIMTSMEMRQDGSIWGTFDLIDTPVGRIVKAFIDAGVIFGISIRGAGDVDSTGKVDPETFIFRGYDLVTFPAYDDAVPEFREIAASSDIQKQSKYKKVCAAIQTNLSKIQSSEALAIIQSQFDDSSEEFKVIGDRIQELSGSDECSEDFSLMSQKLDAVTNLYIKQVQENQKLFDEITALKLDLTQLTASTDRKLRTVERIMGSQVASLEKALTDTENKYHTVVRANAKLKAQNQRHISACEDLQKKLDAVENKYQHAINANANLKNKNQDQISACERLEGKLQDAEKRVKNLRSESRRSSAEKIQAAEELNKTQAELEKVKGELEQVRSSNLIYQRKIESTTQTIADNEQIISDLRSKLSETVTANKKLSQDSSNRDAETESLRDQILAANQLIEEYQQAYADMYAGAIGISVENIPVTATTSPMQLRSYIQGSTSTSGLAARPSFVEPEQLEKVNDDEFLGEDTIVSL